MQLIKRLIVVLILQFFVLGELVRIDSDKINSQTNLKRLRKEKPRKIISLT